VTEYIVEAGSSYGSSDIITFRTGNASTTLTVAGVPAGRYYVRLRASVSGIVGLSSADILVLVGECTAPPSAPVSFEHTVAGSVVTLSWSAGIGGCPASSFLITAGLEPGSGALVAIPVTGNGISVVAPNGTYYVRIYALNAFGQSYPSIERAIVVGPSGCTSPPPTPTAPTPVVTGSAVQLSWAPLGGCPATTYTVLISPALSGPPITTTTVTGTTAMVTPASPGTYYARVVANNAYGSSVATASVPFTIVPAGCTSPPTSPTNLTRMVSGTSVQFTWTAGAGGCVATGYTVSVGTTPGGTGVSSATVTTTSATINIAASGTYYARVNASNAYGSSGPSGEVTFSIAPTGCATVPNPPTNFQAIASGLTANLSWSSPVGGCAVSGYVVRAGTVSGGTNAGSVTAAGTTSSVSFHTAGKYYLRVHATNAYGESAPSNEVTLTVSSPTIEYHVWGGLGYTQYLGFFTCIFCQEFATNSINNQFGSYGSAFSSTSIRNEFSQYGSQFSSYSACNQFASNPPRVYNADGSIYYGELTINEFRSAAISGLISWLVLDVCAH
jgi:hypothetical protein